MIIVFNHCRFICDLLAPYQDFIYIIDKIAIGAKDITNVIKHRFYIQNATKDVLTNAIASHIAALSNDIQYNPDIPDDNLYVNK